MARLKFIKNICSFLESAQILEISGLLGDSKEDSNNRHDYFQNDDDEESKRFSSSSTYMDEVSKPSLANERDLVSTTNTGLAAKPRRQNYRTATNDLPKYNVGAMTQDEIEAKIKSLYQKVDGIWTCLECNRTAVNSSNIRIHVETHIDGLCYTCKFCSKEFRFKIKLYDHHKVCKQ